MKRVIIMGQYNDPYLGMFSCTILTIVRFFFVQLVATINYLPITCWSVLIIDQSQSWVGVWYHFYFLINLIMETEVVILFSNNTALVGEVSHFRFFNKTNYHY